MENTNFSQNDVPLILRRVLGVFPLTSPHVAISNIFSFPFFSHISGFLSAALSPQVFFPPHSQNNGENYAAYKK